MRYRAVRALVSGRYVPRVGNGAARPTDAGYGARTSAAAARCAAGRAHGDEAAYRDYRDRYRAMATSLGFEGHMKWAEAMP